VLLAFAFEKRIEQGERFDCRGALNGLSDKVEGLLKRGF
jgi:hypothetical protein